MNSHNSDVINQTPFRFITRLRGPPATNPTERNISPGIKTKTPARTSISPTISGPNRKNRDRSKSPQQITKKSIQGGVTDSMKYTIFTSKPPSNTLIISSKPITGKNINETFKSTGDLYEFSRSILKETSILEFDQTYNEATKLDTIYLENIKDSISNLFHGKNACFFFFGPIDGGKSYCLRGGVEQSNTEPGLLSRGIGDIFNLVDLSRQANQSTQSNHFFVVKLSVYQVYLDFVHDLIAKETKQVKIEQYYGENGLQTNLIGLTQKEIKNKLEYDQWIKEAVHQRKCLSQILKVNELKRKSHLVISISLEKREKTSDGITKTNERAVDNYSQIDFVELASSNFGLMNNDDEDLSQNGILYRNTSKVFNSISNNIISINSNITPKNETKLTLCLKQTLKPKSKIVFICCAIPWEFPHGQSIKAIKFTNWLRNQIGNVTENQSYAMQGNDNNTNYYNTYSSPEQNYVTNDNNVIQQQEYSNDKRGYNTINTSKPFQEDYNNRNNARYSQQLMDRNNKVNNPNLNMNQEEVNSNLHQRSSSLYNTINKSEGLNRISPYHSVNLSNDNYINQKSNLSTIKNTQPYDSAMKDNKNYSSNEENELKCLRERARRKYQSVEMQPQHQSQSQMQTSQHQQLRSDSFIPMNNSSGMNQNNNDKLQSLEQSLRQLEEKNNEMNNCLENLRLERSRIDESQHYQTNYPNKLTSYNLQTEVELEKYRTEHATLKSDNIIFREDINRLTDLNRHLEEELQKQRNRNLELAAENERFCQEKNNLTKELDKSNEIIMKHKTQDQSIMESFNQRMVIETKLRDTESDFNKLREEKQKYEIDYKVLKERYDELLRKYTEIDSETKSTKAKHNEEVSKIEEKIDIMTREIDSLQKENAALRTNDERARMDILSLEKQRDTYRDKYTEQKQKNTLLNSKLTEIEEDFKRLLLDRQNEENMKQREEETKRVKVDSKVKIVNELQNKIANYRTERLRKKQENSN